MKFRYLSDAHFLIEHGLIQFIFKDCPNGLLSYSLRLLKIGTFNTTRVLMQIWESKSDIERKVCLWKMGPTLLDREIF